MTPITLPVAPVAKPRMVRSDKWRRRPSVVKYWAYADLLRLAAYEAGYKLADRLKVAFYIPMPKSWSKRKRQEYAGKPHRSRPDLDNLVKAFCDALATGEDDFVWQLEASKYWANEGKILVWPVENNGGITDAN